MTSTLSYDNALHIAQKGKYYPQPTNHAGLPTHPVFCDYCGRGRLGGSWKAYDIPQWDLCMQCYVVLQSSNNATFSGNGTSLPISGNLNQEFHSHFTNNLTNNQYDNQANKQSNNSNIPSYWQQQHSNNLDNYQSAWNSDVPGSYSNRIITSKDGWVRK